MPPGTVSTRYGSTDVSAGSISALGRWNVAAPAATASATNGAAVGAPSIVSCWIGSPRDVDDRDGDATPRALASAIARSASPSAHSCSGWLAGGGSL